MKGKNIVLAFMIIAMTSSALFTIHPAKATTYTVGAKAGDFVKYGTVSATFTSNVSSTPTPQYIKDMQATSFFRFDVLSVSGTNATLKWTASYTNGTVLTETINWDVQSVSGNTTSLKGSLFPIPLLFGAGLTTSDKLCTGTNCSGTSTPPSYNSTQSRTYAGASRTDGVISSTQTNAYGSFSLNAYWDQSTGAFMEYSVSATQTIPGFGSNPAQKQTYTLNTAATETSLWSANILGVSPLVFYGIIGAIIVVIAIVAAVMIMRMRKPKTPAMPSPPGTTTPPPGQ